jgi:hypothetical protein
MLNKESKSKEVKVPTNNIISIKSDKQGGANVIIYNTYTNRPLELKNVQSLKELELAKNLM